MAISIALSSLNETVDVMVEGLGVIKVSKETSNQGLKTSENMRDIFKLQEDGKKLDKRLKKLLAEGKKEGDPEIEKLERQGTEKIDRITEVRRSEYDLKRARLSDDEGGKLVERLYNEASDEDIARIFAVADGKEQAEDGGTEDES